MSLITIILTLVVVGVVLYLINRFIPMADNIKQMLNIVVIIILALWLLKIIGLWGYLAGIKV
jgi:hypothetical protein